MLVQAFVVPDDQHHVENGKGELRLSHEGIFSSDKDSFVVIRNSVLDPITGDIGVKILEQYRHSHAFQPNCVDLTLHKPAQNGVSPITIDLHPVLIQGDAPTHDGPRPTGICHDSYHFGVSDDGYARGWFNRTHSCSRRGTFDGAKFTIDATSDRCMAVLSRISSAEWDAIMYPTPYGKVNVALDSARGRLSYAHNTASGRGAIVVVDLE